MKTNPTHNNAINSKNYASTANYVKLLIVAALAFLSSHLNAALITNQQQLAVADNGFAFRLLKQLASGQPDANIFVSPYSAATALQMVCNGAGGRTKLEMQRVLGIIGLQQDVLNEANSTVATSLNSGNTNVVLATANALWYRKGTAMKSEFVACNQRFFGATVTPLDFDKPYSVDAMNSWAREKTHGRIIGIIDGPIDPATKVFLANAVYFKGKWDVPFEMKDTKDRLFHLRGDRQKKIPMMEQSRKFTYRKGTGYQSVRLPYQGLNLAMYIFLPDVGSTPEKLLSILNGDTWQRVTKPGFDEKDGTVVLPKFKIEYSADLKQPLKLMGMNVAFGDADFSGISSNRLFISAVQQRAFVEVKEEGTEAAAATGITAIPMGMEMVPPNPFEMVVDRPFLFLIEDQQTGIILFMGTVFDP